MVKSSLFESIAMQFVILGSGGAIPVPRPFCQCGVCKKARKGVGRRNHCSAFLTEANFLFDAGEDIKESLNRENIKQVDAVFLTHWHPDHSFGLREVFEAYYDFRHKKPKKTFTFYVAKKVFRQLRGHFPAINYYLRKKLAKVNFLEHGQSVKAKGAKVTAIGFTGKGADTFGFLIETKRTRLFYAPCDTIQLKEEFIPETINVLVQELGLFSWKLIKSEISFPDLVKRIEIVKPKETILTHIEEIELKNYGKKIEEIEKKYKRLNLRLAFDGKRIKL